MFLDASAIVAILAREPDANTLMQRLATAKRVLTSPVAVFEAVLALQRIGNVPLSAASHLVDGFLGQLSADIVAIDGPVGREAIAAFERFGKGRHPAALNMGDCFAYACAHHHQVPLLFKGSDFAATDIQSA